MPLPNDIQNGDDLDAVKAMENWDACFDEATTARTEDINSSRINWDTPVPPDALGGITFGQGGGSAGDTSILSDPLYARMLGVAHVRRSIESGLAGVVAAAPQGTVRPVGVKGGFLICDHTGNNVHEIPRNRTGAQDTLLNGYYTHAFTSGDGPAHAVQVNATDVYVVCDGSSFRGIKKFTLGASSAPTSVVDLTASYDNLGKCCINRQGTYLYVAGKATGQSHLDRIVRVDIKATTPVATATTATETNQNIVDLAVLPGSAGGQESTGNVYFLQDNTAGAGGRLSFIAESQTSAYGGAIGSTVTTIRTYSGANDLAYGMCVFRGKVAVVVHDGTNITCHWEEYGMQAGAGTPAAGAFTLFSTAPDATEAPLRGCVATDGNRVICGLTDGQIAMFLFGADWVTLMKPSQGITVGAAFVEDTSGLAFNGETFLGLFNVTGATRAVPFML